MKHCPQCGRDYVDDTLSFCLDDGTPLLVGTAGADEAATAFLLPPDTHGESETRVFDPPAGRERGTFLTGRARHVIFAISVLLIAVFGASFYYLIRTAPSSLEVGSIAVIPFANDSGDPEIEYLSDGLTESLIGSLSRVPDLSVKASSTVFFFKGKQYSAKQIGDKLKVEAVVLGRMVKHGNDLSLNLELVDTGTEDVIWSGQFSRKLSELPSLQSEIARQVAERIRSTLTGDAEKNIGKEYTSDSAAYDAYLRGRFYWNQRSERGFKRSIEYFQKAIEADPNYALAWSGIADTYFLLPEYGPTPASEALPKARAAAERAVSIDPNLAEAYASLGYVKHSWEWRFREAEQDYRKSIELNPNYANAHQWYSELLAQEQRFDEAEKEGLKAIELDPLSFIKSVAYAQTLWLKGENDKALQLFAKAQEAEPDFPLTYKLQCEIYIAKREIQKAVKACETATKKGGKSFEFSAGIAYAAEGDRKKALDLISGDGELSTRQLLDKALTYAALGNKKEALDAVRQIVDSRSVFALYVEVLPDLKSLNDDPEFREIVDRIGLRN